MWHIISDGHHKKACVCKIVVFGMVKCQNGQIKKHMHGQPNVVSVERNDSHHLPAHARATQYELAEAC
jgi:hypothetical protein